MNNVNPIISVIIPLYNSKLYVSNAIKSVIDQNFAAVELIVIDGKSSDGSWEIVKQYMDNISYCISEPDAGIYEAMNKGIKKAKGQWIYFLGADDILDAHVLKRIEPYLSTNLTMVYGDIRFDN